MDTKTPFCQPELQLEIGNKKNETYRSTTPNFNHLYNHRVHKLYEAPFTCAIGSLRPPVPKFPAYLPFLTSTLDSVNFPALSFAHWNLSITPILISISLPCYTSALFILIMCLLALYSEWDKAIIIIFSRFLLLMLRLKCRCTMALASLISGTILHQRRRVRSLTIIYTIDRGHIATVVLGLHHTT